MNIRLKYQIAETSTQFSFRPFYQYKKRWKWYVLGIIVVSALLPVYFHQLNDGVKTIALALLIVLGIFLIKDVLLKPAIVYVFDEDQNAVYQKTVFSSYRKILNLNEVVVFQSSEMGGWHYTIGAKRKQFLKNFAISEMFAATKNNQKLIDYNNEILLKIEQSISAVANNL